MVTLIALAIVSLAALSASHADARRDERSELVYGANNIVLGQDYSRTVPVQILEHTGRNHVLNVDRFAMGFSEDAGVPAIAQSSVTAESGQVNGFFFANFCYCDFENMGVRGVGTGGASASTAGIQPVTKSPTAVAPTAGGSCPGGTCGKLDTGEFKPLSISRWKVVDWSPI